MDGQGDITISPLFLRFFFFLKIIKALQIPHHCRVTKQVERWLCLMWYLINQMKPVECVIQKQNANNKKNV